MKRLALMLGTCALLTGASAQAAHADDTYLGNFEVKVGVMSPSGSNLNSGTAFSFGGEYEFKSNATDKNGGTALSLSADFVQIPRQDNFFSAVPVMQGNNVVLVSTVVQNTVTQTTVPVLVNVKFYNSGGPDRLYAGVGVGAFMGDYSGFAYQAEAGYVFSNHWDFSVRYIGNGGSSTVNNSSLSGLFGADIAFRF